MWTKKEVASFVDLTTLNSYDSVKSVGLFLDNALNVKKQGLPVAAVCLYPNFASLAVKTLESSEIKVAVVAGNFPSSQGFLPLQLKECEKAIELGVDEVDIVLNLGAFDDERYEEVTNEIKEFKKTVGRKDLKVILETGYLKTPERIRLASQLAIAGGANFIKTSTGKDFPGASIEAVKIMAETIKTEKVNVGIKASGGIRTYQEALEYIHTVENLLGNDFIHPDTFRIGASSLIKNLLND